MAYEHLKHNRQHRLFRIVADNAADMIALVEVTGKRVYNSPAYEKVLGYSLAELRSTSSFDQIHPDDRQQVAEAAKQARLTGMGKRLEYRMRHKDGNWRVLESTANAIRNRKGQVTHLVIVNRDITERKRVEQQLEHDALHDTLTGLPNRRLFVDRLQHAIEHAKRNPDFKFAVLFIDIQGLKIFNDTMGLSAVDQLLIEISNRFRMHLRRDDTVSRSSDIHAEPGGEEILARMDGQQFTVLVEGIKAPSDAMRVAMRLQESLGAPLTANGVDAFTSASIGIALSSPLYNAHAEMMRDADIAMCRAKASHSSGCQVFDSQMHALVVQRLKVETELRKAIDRADLRVFYQPIVELSSGHICGVEALVRWWHDDAELIGPADFIQVAEETGLIVPIGRFVLREVCRQAREWQTLFPNYPPLTTMVNISPRQFAQSDLVRDVSSALEESGVRPETLELEITETVAMNDTKYTRRIFSRLKEIGVQLSIDDFGTGHSSLNRLRSFPVDVLKIDRSFVQGIDHDADTREVCRLIVTLAHHLNLKVIAEGIETPIQRGYLEEFGCEFGQGYFYSRPVDREMIEKLLQNASPHSDRVNKYGD